MARLDFSGVIQSMFEYLLRRCYEIKMKICLKLISVTLTSVLLCQRNDVFNTENSLLELLIAVLMLAKFEQTY